MKPREVEAWIAKLQTLPSRGQAACVMLASHRCEQLARSWFEREGLLKQYENYRNSLAGWLEGGTSDDELEKAGLPLNRRLNRDVEREKDVVGAMAGHSITDVQAIALGYSPEMLEEILLTAVFFAAAAFTGSKDVPVQVDSDRLSSAELGFIEEWWRECCGRFPALAG